MSKKLAFCLFTALGAMGATLPARAQIARVTAVQTVVEKSSGASDWKKAPVGTPLLTTERLRTGRRSKADVKFTDGSLIRLGQLSSIEFRAEREAALSAGKLLFSFLKPGRILAGAGAAEIKGTVGLVEVREDGSVKFALYSGLLDVVTRLRTLTLHPGQEVDVDGAGRFGNVHKTAPLAFAEGDRLPTLNDSPLNVPYVGSVTHETVRQGEPERSVDFVIDHVAQTLPPGVSPSPFVLGNGNSGSGDPLPLPFPTPPGPVPTPFPTLPPRPLPRMSAQPLSSPRAAITVSRPIVAGRIAQNFAGRSPAPFLLAAAPQSATPRNFERDLPQPDLNRGADDHMSQVNRDLGEGGNTDARFLAGFGDEGERAIGGRFHAYGTKGKWFLDGAFTPLRVTRNPGALLGKINENQTTISDASLTYRDKWGDIQAGRLRYLAGPSQVTLFGSLARQGGRDIMDGVRFSPRIGKNQKLEISYLYDAYVRQLPYSVPGPQKALFGRYSVQEEFGNFGLNLFKYTSSPVPDTLGATVDFGLPVVPGQLEFYGEVGRDPFRRRLTSFGVYLPGFYQKTGVDVFLEYAKLRASSVTTGVPNELALRVYKRINKNVDVMATASRFSNSESSFVLGLSIGDAIDQDR